MTHSALIKELYQLSDVKFHPVSGGDINAVYSVFNARNEQSIIKINAFSAFPQMLEKEANGLNELRKNKHLQIPNVHSHGKVEGLQYLILSHIEEDIVDSTFWEKFGEGLAAQHQISSPTFGLKEDNYIGSLPQSNQLQRSWHEFIVNERFIPQIKLALDQKKINTAEAKKIERIYSEVDNIWPREEPALLHGDLWSGNYIKGTSNQPFLIDPAVYYGHREMDLGMMHLFGGFENLLYETYNNFYPLEIGWKDRIKFNQLYPLLVHLNLFGRAYLNQINGIVNRF